LYPVHGHRTAIFDVEIVLNQWLEEIAKKEAPAKAALISTIAAAIQAAVAEKERSPSSSFVKGLLAKRARV